MEIPDYFPGHKPSTSAFRIMNLSSGLFIDKILQFDSNYQRDTDSKKCTLNTEPLSRYYQYVSGIEEKLTKVNTYLYSLLKDLPIHVDNFIDHDPYINFHHIAEVIQEDLVVYDTKHQRTIAIHLCHANDWTAEGWIGKDFEWIHRKIRNNLDQLTIPNPNKFVGRIMACKQPIERVGAINFNAVSDLNRHPNRTNGENRKFDLLNPSLFMRVERQTVSQFPEDDMFLFTIKTHFYNCTDSKYIDTAIDIFENPHKDLYSMWYVKNFKDEVLPWLKSIKEKKI